MPAVMRFVSSFFCNFHSEQPSAKHFPATIKKRLGTVRLRVTRQSSGVPQVRKSQVPTPQAKNVANDISGVRTTDGPTDRPPFPCRLVPIAVVLLTYAPFWLI